MSAALPCPFCGSADVRVALPYAGDVFHVECYGSKCGAIVRTGARSQADAIEAWNRRVSLATPAGDEVGVEGEVDRAHAGDGPRWGTPRGAGVWFGRVMNADLWMQPDGRILAWLEPSRHGIDDRNPEDITWSVGELKEIADSCASNLSPEFKTWHTVALQKLWESLTKRDLP